MTTTAIATRITAGGLIWLLGWAVVGCGTHVNDTRVARPAQVCGPRTFPAPYTWLDSCSASAVMVAAVVAIFDVGSGRGKPQAAFDSAAVLLDPGYLRRVGASGSVLSPIGGAQWARWAQTGVEVFTTAAVTSEDHPADTAWSARRVVAISEQPEDGEPATRFAAHVGVARNEVGGPWLVDMVEVAA